MTGGGAESHGDVPQIATRQITAAARRRAIGVKAIRAIIWIVHQRIHGSLRQPLLRMRRMGKCHQYQQRRAKPAGQAEKCCWFHLLNSLKKTAWAAYSDKQPKGSEKQNLFKVTVCGSMHKKTRDLSVCSFLMSEHQKAA